ncbi:MAG: ABC transporter permease [Ktedonobacteraceae bacterium]
MANLDRVAPRQQAIRHFTVAGLLRGGMTYAVLGSVILLIIYNLISTPRFLTLSGLTEAIDVNLLQVAPIAIVATGMTLVIATGGIDLSVGSIMAIAGAIAPMIFLSSIPPLNNPFIGIVLGIIVPILVAGLLGLFNGFLITTFRIQPIIATLVLFIAGRGMAQVISNGNIQVFRGSNFVFLGSGRILNIPVQVILMLIVIMVVAWIVRTTTFGRYLLATGGNEAASRLAGVPTDRVKRAVYVISAMLAGLAGLIIVAINSSSDASNVGLNGELDAIAAVAVGGTPFTGGQASVWGTLLGALLIQLIRFTLVTKNIPLPVAQIINAAIILFAVYLQLSANRRSQ